MYSYIYKLSTNVNHFVPAFPFISHQTFNYSKSTIETLEKGVKYVQVSNNALERRLHSPEIIKNTGVVLVPLMLTLNIFYNFF